MFRFGGSSTVTVFEPGKVRLADDLLKHSAECCELYACMGEVMGRAAESPLPV
jgi:phosphatidylserine decarboxylase